VKFRKPRWRRPGQRRGKDTRSPAERNDDVKYEEIARQYHAVADDADSPPLLDDELDRPVAGS